MRTKANTDRAANWASSALAFSAGLEITRDLRASQTPCSAAEVDPVLRGKTSAPWPLSSRSISPLPASHTRAVRSAEAVTMQSGGIFTARDCSVRIAAQPLNIDEHAAAVVV